MSAISFLDTSIHEPVHARLDGRVDVGGVSANPGAAVHVDGDAGPHHGRDSGRTSRERGPSPQLSRPTGAGGPVVAAVGGQPLAGGHLDDHVVGAGGLRAHGRSPPTRLAAVDRKSVV